VEGLLVKVVSVPISILTHLSTNVSHTLAVNTPLREVLNPEFNELENGLFRSVEIFLPPTEPPANAPRDAENEASG
jgi:hypothetical protein